MPDVAVAKCVRLRPGLELCVMVKKVVTAPTFSDFLRLSSTFFLPSDFPTFYDFPDFLSEKGSLAFEMERFGSQPK